ncbi:MAG: mechanosensitive ion channel family protein [Gammaproteobacteria bacterium]|nr:mechanosensitive ion channel family protein [Gammaproteobacteria bacterium]
MKYVMPLQLVVLLIVVCLSQVAFATDDALTLKEITEKQEKAQQLKDTPEEIQQGPYDEYNRTTPRGSVIGLANALNENDYTTATQYLDLRNLPFTIGEADGPDLARKLKTVAVRSMLIDYESLSADPKGHTDDGLPSYRDRVTTIKTVDGPVDILLQRVPRGDGVSIWKISNATVAMIPKLNEEFGYGVIGDQLSMIFPHYVISGFELWQLMMLVVLLVCCYAVAYLITIILLWIRQRAIKGGESRFNRFIAGPARLLMMVILFRASFETIAPSLTARALFEAKTFLVIAVTWFSMGVVDMLLWRLSEHMERNGQHDAVVLLKPAGTALKFTVVFIAIIVWLDNLGYQVTTLIAGLGVGGVAVAFAAQRSIENLIGSIIIYTSQPVRVGDFCKFGEVLGTVEEIGLRATVLRTLERTLVHIPNAKFSTDAIENLTQRDKILYRCRLRLSYETSPAQIRMALEKIRALIQSHDFIDEESSRVRFIEFAQYAQELELFIYIRTIDYAQFLEQREDVNLKILDLLEDAGVKLVIPATTTYLEHRDNPAVL